MNNLFTQKRKNGRRRAIDNCAYMHKFMQAFANIQVKAAAECEFFFQYNTQFVRVTKSAVFYWKCIFPMNPHVRLLVGRPMIISKKALVSLKHSFRNFYALLQKCFQMMIFFPEINYSRLVTDD